jgi:hypothetical protein
MKVKVFHISSPSQKLPEAIEKEVGDWLKKQGGHLQVHSLAQSGGERDIIITILYTNNAEDASS